MKWIIGTFRRQLDSSAATFTAYEKRSKEVRERVVQETLFTLLLCRGFWSPVNETVRRVSVNDKVSVSGEGKTLTRTSRAALGWRGWYIPCRAAVRVHWCAGPAKLKRVNGRSKKVTRMNLRHTRREARAWFTAPDLEWGMDEAIEECWDAGGVRCLPRIWLRP